MTFAATVGLCCIRRSAARSQTVGRSSRGSCWTEWAVAGVHSAVMLHNCSLACRRLHQDLISSVQRTWRRVVAVWRRHVRVVARWAPSIAVTLDLWGKARVVLTTVLRAAWIRRGGRHVHGRVSACGCALFLLQELLGVAVLVVWPLRVVLGLVGVGVLHLHVAVVVVEVRAAAARLAGRLQRDGAGARGRRWRCVRVLLKLRRRAGVSLRVL